MGPVWPSRGDVPPVCGQGSNVHKVPANNLQCGFIRQGTSPSCWRARYANPILCSGLLQSCDSRRARECSLGLLQLVASGASSRGAGDERFHHYGQPALEFSNISKAGSPLSFDDREAVSQSSLPGWHPMPLTGFDRPGLELLSAQGLESALLEAIALQNETVSCHPGKDLRIFPSSPR